MTSGVEPAKTRGPPQAHGAGFLTLAAGLLHLGLAPLHADHAYAHGLALGVLGLAQVSFAAAFLLRPDYWLAVFGILLQGSSVTLWTITRVARAPFVSHHEEVFDVYGLGFATKVLELAAIVVFVVYARRSATARSQPNGLGAPWTALVVGLVFGYVAYGSALVTEEVFPELGEGDHGHDEDPHDDGHDHGAPLGSDDPHAGHTNTPGT